MTDPLTTATLAAIGAGIAPLAGYKSAALADYLLTGEHKPLDYWG